MAVVEGIAHAEKVRTINLIQRVVSNFSWSIVSEVAGKGFLFLVTIYLARTLSIENYGIFVFAQTFISFFWIVSDLGINMYGSREISKDINNVGNILDSLLTLRIISSLIVFTLLVLSIQLFITDVVKKLILTGSSFYLVSRSFNIEWVFRGLEKFNYIALGNFATFVTMLILMWLLVKSNNDVVLASYIWSLTYLLGSVTLISILFFKFHIKFEFSFDVKQWLVHIKESIHFTISGGLSTLYYYLPIIYLGFFATEYEAGLFSAPFRLVVALIFLFSLVSMSLYPIFSELYHTNKTQFNRLYKYYLIGSVISGLLLGSFGMMFSKQIILLLFGDKFTNSTFVLKLLIWFPAVISLRAVYIVILAASGLQKFYSLATLVSVILLSIIFYVLRIFGISYIISASVSLIITEVGISVLLITIWTLKSKPHPNP